MKRSSQVRAAQAGQGGIPRVACINLATVPLQGGLTLESLTIVLQACYDQHFLPVWGYPLHLYATKTPAPSDWQLVYMDTADEAGALGYHDLTKNGQPVSKIFVKTTQSASELVSVTACHELFEMSIDPLANLWAQAANGKMYAYEMCFTGDTMIPLLDGTQVAIADLVGREEFWVYSIASTGHIAPGRGHSCRKTVSNASIVEIELDDGATFRCTTNHRIMMRSGEYKMAGELRPDDSLMPLYRQRIAVNSKDPSLDYEQVLDPKTQEWRFTHRIVSPACPKGHVRHHVNFNRFDNRTDNIRLMTWDDHRRLHQDAIAHARNSPRFKAVQRAKMLALANERRGKPRPAHWKEPGLKTLWRDPEFIEAHKDRARKLVASGALNNETQRAKARANGKDMFEKFWDDPEFRDRHAMRGAATLRAYNGSPEQIEAIGVANHRRWHVARNIRKNGCKHCVAPVNHKVVCVRECGVADVYDFTVDEHHNFAISAGVFVHNCDPCEEDAFLVNGVPMSNFVHPSWFEPFRHPAGTKFDHLGKLKAPFTLDKGGYMIVLDPKTGKTSEVFGSLEKAHRFAQEDRRGHRSEYRKPHGQRIPKAAR